MNELGEWLTRAREARGLTLHDAERDTRISRRYLQALESGELDVIPAPVYARGFLRSYAQYLGLDPQEAMARYPRAEEVPAPQAPRSQGRQPQKPQQARGRQPQAQPHASEQPTIGATPTGNRPTWRRPGPSGGGAEPAAVGEAAPTPRATRPVPMPRSEPAEEEPMIGVDIGVPVPARRLQQDPAAQTRSMAVLIVAVVAIVGILFLALMISRLGGGDEDLDPTNPTSVVEGGGDGEAGDEETPAATQAPTLSGNGLVPGVEGETEEAARAAIEAAGLVPNVIYEPTDAVAPGIVLTQSPGPGIQRSPGDPMTIVVSEAP